MTQVSLRTPSGLGGLRRLLAPTAALSLGVALLAGPAAAQGGKGRFFDPATMEQHRQERLQRTEERIRTRIAPELKLDDRQTDALVELAQEHLNQRHAARVLLRAERDALQVFLREGRSEAEIAEQLDRLLRAQAAMPKPGAIVEDSGRFLTVEQQARLALMLPEKQGKMGKGRGWRGKTQQSPQGDPGGQRGTL